MQILFSGPTYCAPILQTFKNQCVRDQGKSVYNILLILTDGEINDMPATKRAIVDLSYEACSIIIVGIGNENFANMHELDSDHKALTDDQGR